VDLFGVLFWTVGRKVGKPNAGRFPDALRIAGKAKGPEGKTG